MVGLFGVAIALFASTNIDDLFVLVGFFADSRFRVAEIVSGQYAGIAALVGVSVAASLSSALLPLPWMGLLAIVPIVLGAKRLFDLFQTHGRDEGSTTAQPMGRGHGRTATVALVTIANGGDNIGIYTPAFVVHSRPEIMLTVSVFLVMTAVWCLFAHWIVNHPRLGARIRRYGQIVAPAVLIALGIRIMYQANTFGLLWRLL
jgi:cadmium resistance protein CadD (predicted permease)